MLTIVAFIITGVLVNVGVNKSHRYIGTYNWNIPGAPFVGGFGGFAKVFVTASFACKLPWFSRLGMLLNIPPRILNSLVLSTLRRITDGGTESLGITAGETKNPTRNMPRIVKFVFFRFVRSLTLPLLVYNFTYDHVHSILLFYILSILLIGLNSNILRVTIHPFIFAHILY